MQPLVIVLIVLAAGLFAYAIGALKIVRQYEKGLVERFGRFKRAIDPGLNFIIPFIERVARVDMRE